MTLDPDDLVILSGKSFDRVTASLEGLRDDLPDLTKASWIEGYTTAVAEFLRGQITWTTERQLNIYEEAESAWERRPT
jgi:hypothetical protein